MGKEGMFKRLLVSMLFVLFMLPAQGAFADVIVDNGGSGASSTGTWSVSGGTGPYGANSVYARPSATHTWQFNGQPAGEYEVLMWWTTTSSRGDNILVDINGATSQTVSINQLQNGSQWNSLGTYTFGSSGSVVITASADILSDGRTVSTCADAVWFRQVSGNIPPVAAINSISPNPASSGATVTFDGSDSTDSDGSVAAYSWDSDIVGPLSVGAADTFATTLADGIHEISLTVQDNEGAWSTPVTMELIVGDIPIEVIVDNGDSDTSSTGSWYNSSGTNPYGSNSLYARPSATYTWELNSQPAGSYEVYLYWTTTSTRGTSVPYDINGIETVNVNQLVSGGQWNYAGTYYFDGSGYVTVTAVGTTSTSADAVRFVSVNTNSQPTANIVSITPNPAGNGESVSFNGEGSDVDGTIAAYEWTSSIDGLLSIEDIFSSSGLSEAIHEISFRVQDDQGSWSDPVLASLGVGFPDPVAVIDSISPNPAAPGADVTFQGHGDAFGGAVIDGYNWTSSLDGEIGTTASFTIDTLSVGDHTIELTVLDDNGGISTPVQETLSIVYPDIIVDNGDSTTSFTGSWNNSSGANPYGSESLYARPAATYTWAFNNQPPGMYEVSLYWTTVSSRGASVPYDINGIETVEVNQLASGGQWNPVGTYYFDGSGYVTVTAVGTTSTCADAVRFQFVSANNQPTAEILDISPNPAPINELISFSGQGADTDGSITGYSWDSNVDGHLSDAAAFSAILTEGTHDITFSVMDDEGSWSVPVSTSVSVIDSNVAPTASIDSISPNPADSGVAITFDGSGDDSDGSVVAYSWDSDIDGHLSDDALFSMSLTDGIHAITFSVQDDGGKWSAPATASLNAGNIMEDEAFDNGGSGTSSTGSWFTSSRPNWYGTESLYARDGATYTWTFTPSATANYVFSMWWTDYSNRANNVPVALAGPGGTIDTIYINQQNNGGQWNVLGQYALTAGVTYSATITAQPGPSSTCADAVRFVQVSDEAPPIANFTANTTGGVAPVLVQFSDSSVGDPTSWLWDFGDGATSTEQNPSHEYVADGNFTVSLTATNAYGSDTETKNGYIQMADSAVENIYHCIGWGGSSFNWVEMGWKIAPIGAVQIDSDTWRYTNTQKGVTYYIHRVDTVAGFEAAIREPGSHVIFSGHSNYGLGLSFNSDYEQRYVKYFDDPLIANVSTDFTAPSISGLQFGQAYPDWEPVYQNGESAIMPYDFDDPIGLRDLNGPLPPYNYLASYSLPDDPNTFYRVEAADGSYIERFPRTVPAWFSEDGSAPDPNNPDHQQYFITNPDENFPHVEYVGEWPWDSPGDWHDGLYNSQTIQYHNAGSGNNTATFYHIVREPGTYNIYSTWHPDSVNATNTPYTIQHTSLSAPEYTTVLVNQEVGTDKNYIGTFDFNEIGMYTIVISDNANGRVIADSIWRSNAAGPQQYLRAEFSSDLREGSAPLTVQFIDRSGSYDVNVRRTSRTYHWDFGDGNTSDEEDPMHTYTSPGVRTVSCTVTDHNGNVSTETKEAYIHIDTPVASAPKAEFYARYFTGGTPRRPRFYDISTGDITSRLWDFGNGTTSTSQNPRARYNDVGTYTVSLTVTGPDGSDTKTKFDYVVARYGSANVDNTDKYRFHYGSLYRDSYSGRAIMDARPVSIPSEEYRYSRFFFNGCVSEDYYLPKFTQGIVFYTIGNRDGLIDPADEYLVAYLQGATDDELLQIINEVHFIHGYYDFNKLPPSMR